MSGLPAELVRGFEPEEGFALSTEAGWNQTVADWRRLLRLVPQFCLGIREHGQLVASAVSFPYSNKLAWIGMVLTAVAHRGKGHASALLRQCLEDLDQLGVECVKLDATELGRPVYQKLGFVEERPVSRWVRRPGPGPQLAPWEEIEARLDETLLAQDAGEFGADRSVLLREFAQEEVLAIPGQAMVFSRPGRTARHLGPCLARDSESALALLSCMVARHGESTIFWDLFEENETACSLARALGFEPSRQLTRMYRGGGACSNRGWSRQIYALASFEYG
ncbi:MAG: GNAT family N-acetyltransferase [Bryobacteraceae bacterium]|nr:GNAT family N-acetyltransferase [Bryobacteraceae bacterium]MDW8379840.1 GNAT family N-acetyltransferase [Bryobacterales bacterium]